MKYKDDKGYIRISKVTNPAQYVYEHRAIMENRIGRSLQFCEVVHHIDGCKSNNNPENLVVIDPKTHRRIHRGWVQSGDEWIKKCSGCDRWLEVNETNFHKRRSLFYKGEFQNFCIECCRTKNRLWQKKRKNG